MSRVKISSLPAELADGTRFVGLEDIAPREGQIVNYSEASTVRSSVSLFQSGDILYGRLRPYLRKVAIAEFSGCASNEIIILRCSDKIMPSYLQLILLSEDFNQFVSNRVTGDRPRISFETIAGYLVDIPAIEVQAEVCIRDSGLTAALAQISLARIRGEAAAASLMEGARTKLLWTASSSSNLIPFESLVESIDYGTSTKSIFGGAGVPVLRIPNIKSGRIDISELKYSPLSANDLDKYNLKAGDILVIRSNGSLTLVGQAASVSIEHEAFSFAGYLLRVRPRPGVCSEYLLQLMRSKPFRLMIADAARSSTGINNLSAGRLKAFRVPSIPTKKQLEIVKTLDRLDEASAQSSVALNENVAAAEILQKMARRGWLGQGTPIPESDSSSIDAPRFPDASTQGSTISDMTDSIETVILKRLRGLPSSTGRFEAAFSGISADYDVIRDAVFGLLTRDPAQISQVFDKKTKSIVLKALK